MSAAQINAKVFNPNLLNLARVASYDRVVDAPIERAWENVLDWAHLPHLHDSSFDYVALQDAADWGWRTWSNAGHTDHVELTVVDDERYVARSYQGGQQISEIWTTLRSAGDQTNVHVEFYFPDIATENIAPMRHAILSLYTRLWDEDEAMMSQRQMRLVEQRETASEMALGSESSLLQKLQDGATIIFQLHKREFQLRERHGRLIAHSSICPHLLGPLTDADLSAGTLACPWHGYTFDLETGDCIWPKEAACKLSPPPRLLNVGGNIIARA